VSVVYGTTANVASAAIRNFRIGFESNRGRPIQIQIESRSFAGLYLEVWLVLPALNTCHNFVA